MKKVTILKTVTIKDDEIKVTEEIVVQPTDSRRQEGDPSSTAHPANRGRSGGVKAGNCVVVNINNNNSPR